MEQHVEQVQLREDLAKEEVFLKELPKLSFNYYNFKWIKLNLNREKLFPAKVKIKILYTIKAHRDFSDL